MLKLITMTSRNPVLATGFEVNLKITINMLKKFFCSKITILSKEPLKMTYKYVSKVTTETRL